MLNSRVKKAGFVLLGLLCVGLVLDLFSYKAVASSIGTFIGNATGLSLSNASFNVPTSTGVSATQQFNTNAAGTRVFTPTVAYGLDQLGGNMYPLWVGGNGLITGNANTAGADAISNTALNNSDSANNTIYNRNWPFVFNGSTWDRQFTCPSQAVITLTAGTDVVIVAGVSAKNTRICHVDFATDTTASITIQQGTGSTCGTNTAALAGAYPNATAIAFDYSSLATLRTTVAARDMCIHTSTSVTGGGVVIYAQF